MGRTGYTRIPVCHVHRVCPVYPPHDNAILPPSPPSPMTILKEFKEFAVKGNVIDLAVGVFIGGAFGKIVSSLVADVMMPLIGILMFGVNFQGLSFSIGNATIAYGMFIQSVVDFVIVAFVIFLAIKQINRFKKEKPVEPVAPPEEIVLLREIRDSVRK